MLLIDDQLPIRFYHGLAKQIINQRESMKQDARLILASYKAKIKTIISTHPSESIHFHEFLKLLNINGIRLYSKGEIFKIGKFFDNPLKLCRIQVPLEYLELHSMSYNGRQHCFLVKVRSNKAYPKLLNEAGERHEIQSCLAAVIKMLGKAFGNRINWFHELGGSSVAMAVDVAVFRSRLLKIVSGTAHEHCNQSLVSKFLKTPGSKQIEWKNFNSIIKNALPEKAKAPSNEKSLYMTSLSFPSPISYSFSNQKMQSLEMIERKSIDSSSTHRRRISIQNYPSAQIEEAEFKNHFFLSAKKCPIYEKRLVNSPSSLSSRPGKTLVRKTHDRRFKTEMNFFTKSTQISHSKLSKTQESLLKEPNHQNKVEDYVVILQNQSGVQIQI